LSALQTLTNSDFHAKVLHAEKPVIVEFGAAWCGPCKMLEPVLIDLASEYADQVDFFTVDVDQNPDLAMECNVMGVPTVIKFIGGRLTQRMTGYRPKKALVKAFFEDLDG